MAEVRYVVIDYSDEDYLEVGSSVGYFEFEYVQNGYVSSVIYGTANLTSAVTVSTSAGTNKTAGAALLAFNTVLSAGSRLASGVDIVSGSFSLAATPYTFTKATASLTSAVTVSATPYTFTKATVSLTSAVTSTTVGVKVFGSQAAFTSTASVAVSATVIRGATVALSAVNTQSSAADRIRFGAASFSAFNTVVSAAGRIRPAVDITALVATLTVTAVKVFGAQVYSDRLDVGANNFPKDGKIAGSVATIYHTLGNPSPYGNITPQGYTIGGVDGSNATGDITTGAFASNDAAYGTYFDGSHMVYEDIPGYVATSKNIISFWYRKSIDLFGGTILSSAWVEQFSGRIADSSLAIFNNTLQIRSFFGPLAGVPNSSQAQSFDFTLPDTAKNYDWHHYLLKIVDFSDVELFIDGVSQGIIIQNPPGVGSWSLVGRFYIGVRRTGAGSSAALSAPLKGIVKNLYLGGYQNFHINNYYGPGIESKFTFTALGFSITFGEASMTSAFALSATPYDFTKAEVSMASAFAVTAFAGYLKPAEVSMQSAFAFTADPDEISGGVSLTLATVSLVADADVIRSGVVVTTLFADIAVTATTNQLGYAVITAEATLSATPYEFTKASAGITAQASFAAEGRLQQRTRGIVAMQSAFSLTAQTLRIRTTGLQMSAQASVLTGLGNALRGGNITMTAFDTVLSAGKIIEFLTENTIAVTEEQRLLYVALESTVLLVQMANGVNTITAETTDIVVPQEQGRLLAQYNQPTN